MVHSAGSEGGKVPLSSSCPAGSPTPGEPTRALLTGICTNPPAPLPCTGQLLQAQRLPTEPLDRKTKALRTLRFEGCNGNGPRRPSPGGRGTECAYWSISSGAPFCKKGMGNSRDRDCLLLSPLPLSQIRAVCCTSDKIMFCTRSSDNNDTTRRPGHTCF